MSSSGDLHATLGRDLSGFGVRVLVLTLLLLVVATVRPSESPAMARVMADVTADPAKLELAVNAPPRSRQVTFFIDGRKRWTDRSPQWQFGPQGYVRATSFEPGRHRLRTKVALRDGRVKRASRVVYLTPAVGASGSTWRLRRPTRPEVGAPSEPSSPQSASVDAVFDEGFAGWNMDGVGDVEPTIAADVVKAGSGSGKVVLTGSQDRSELILDGSGSSEGPGTIEFFEGDERYYGFSFLIKSMQYGKPGAHNLITQFKSDGDESPNFGLQLWDYQGQRGL